jgi:hypothetical protein
VIADLRRAGRAQLERAVEPAPGKIGEPLVGAWSRRLGGGGGCRRGRSKARATALAANVASWCSVLSVANERSLGGESPRGSTSVRRAGADEMPLSRYGKSPGPRRDEAWRTLPHARMRNGAIGAASCVALQRNRLRMSRNRRRCP